MEAKKQVENEIETDKKPVFNRSNENIEWAKWSWNPYTGDVVRIVRLDDQKLPPLDGKPRKPMQVYSFEKWEGN